MKTLLEVITPKCRILSEEVDEATKEKVMRVSVKWQHASIINANKRRYSKEILQREIKRITPLIEQGKISGASFHPEAMGELDDITHLWESVKMTEDGSCIGVVKIIPTARGRNVQTLIKAGGWVGLSSRGTGTTTRKEEVVDGKKVMVDEINNDFVLLSPGDFVLTPSVPDAGIQRMMESRLEGETDGAVTLEQLKEWGLVEDGGKELTEQAKERLLQLGYNQAMLSGFRGNLEDYKVTRDEQGMTKLRGFRERFAQAIESGYKGTEEQFKSSLKK